MVGDRAVQVADPHRWLEPDTSPECDRWLAGQADRLATHSPSWDDSWSVLQPLLREHIAQGQALRTGASPVWRQGRRFFLRMSADQEHPVLVTCAEDSDERVLIDPHQLDPSGLSTLDAWRPSWFGRLVAYQVSRAGTESPALRVVEVATGRDVDGPVYPGRATAVAWTGDDASFYYVTFDGDDLRQVRHHRLGDAPHQDAVVLSTRCRQVSVSTSPGGRWLSVSTAPGVQRGNQLHLADLTTTDPRAPQLTLIYDGTTTDDQALLKFGPSGLLYAITTDRAPGGRVCSVDPAAPEVACWSTVIDVVPPSVVTDVVAVIDPHTNDVGYLVSSTHVGVARLTLHDRAGAPLAELAPPHRAGTITKLTSSPDEPGRAWFTYTDFTTPPEVYGIELTERRCHPETTPTPVPAPALVHHLSYRCDDGVDVPIFVITPTDHHNQPRPTILTAYGGFAATTSPTYSPSILSWVRAGGIYAIAGIRGGGEYGTSWHAAGRGTNKPRAFADFAAATQWLINHNWTTSAQLAIKGGSHAGLTAAVALTRNPELYAAAVCTGPLTDMVRYPHLGLGQWWLEEFGNPTDREDLETLLRYSPYHRVEPGTRYPPVLIITPRHDARVGAAHARKFTAALQDAQGGKNPILLRTEHEVGHGPAATTQMVDRESHALAFCAQHTGLIAPHYYTE